MKPYFLILSIFAIPCYAEIIDSGNDCGQNCSWKIEDIINENGTTSRLLTVYATDNTKTGSMDSVYNNYHIPWNSYKKTITDVVFEGSATKNEDGTYSNITGITNVGADAFDGANKLKSVTLPDSITKIDAVAFRGTSSLTSITLPDSLKTIGMSAFDNGCAVSEFVIPKSVTSIGNSAFGGWGTPYLTSIILPGSANIPYGAFQNQTALEYIELGDGVKTIGGKAFYNDTKLTTLVIPESVTKIEYNAFENTSSLKMLIIPESVTTIGNEIFKGSGIETLYCFADKKSMCETALTNSNIDLSVLKLYTKTNDGKYVLNGKKYSSLSDLYAGKNLTKRIYTVQEAEAVSKPTGNKFRIRYK